MKYYWGSNVLDQELLKYTKILVKLGKVALVLLIIYLFYYKIGNILISLLSALPGYIMPFIIAFLVAVLIEPLIRFFQKRIKLKRGLAIFLSMILVVGGLITILGLLVASLINELISIYKQLTIHSSEIAQILFNTVRGVQGLYWGMNLPPSIENNLRDKLGSTLGGLQHITMAIVKALENIISGLPNDFIVLLIALLATYFLANDRPKIRIWFKRAVPDQWEEKTYNICSRLIEAFFGFLRAQGILVLITVIQTIIGLLIMKAPYALTMGLIIGACDIVPLVGPGVIYIPWIIWQLSSGHSGFAIGLTVIWFTGIIIRQVLEPKIIGQQVGLHPLATLASLYIGMKIIGAAGIILGPVTVILFLACKQAGIFDSINFKIEK